MPTNTGGYKMAVRIVDAGKVVKIRCLTGIELMRVIGWPENAEDGLQGYPDEFLTSLAGNAFSGFQLMPILAVSLSIAGQCVAPPGEEMDMDGNDNNQEESQAAAADVLSVSDDSSDGFADIFGEGKL